LQEAGKLPVDPIDIPRIAMLGIYPTLESLGLQLTLVCLTLIWLGYQYGRDKRQNMRGLSV
jgi:high-affinity iron transporter